MSDALDNALVRDPRATQYVDANEISSHSMSDGQRTDTIVAEHIDSQRRIARLLNRVGMSGDLSDD